MRRRTAAQEDPEAAEQAFAAASPAYADLKQKYDRSRKTVTRTGAPAPGVSIPNSTHVLYRGRQRRAC